MDKKVVHICQLGAEQQGNAEKGEDKEVNAVVATLKPFCQESLVHNSFNVGKREHNSVNNHEKRQDDQ